MKETMDSNLEKKPVLSVRGISKNFGGIQALQKVNFDLYDNECLAILGDNGAGKSTLIKTISGAYAHDEGDIFVDTKKVRISSPKDSKKFGISVVYQDLALFDSLDVTQNLFMSEPISKYGFLLKKKMELKGNAILGELKTTVKSLKQRVQNLSGGQQHSVAIGRSVYLGNSKIIIMDEPTAGLGMKESRKVLDLLKKLRREKPIILISHNLDHVFEVADRALVLRSGRITGIVEIKDTTREEIIDLMLNK